jgi:hypothetical protein
MRASLSSGKRSRFAMRDAEVPPCQATSTVPGPGRVQLDLGSAERTGLSANADQEMPD